MATGLQSVVNAIRGDIVIVKGEAESKTAEPRVRELIGEAIDKAAVGALKFTGFIGTEQPATAHVAEGNLWAAGARGAAPNFGSLTVKEWNGSAWVNTEYTPAVFNVWSDTDEGYKGYYLFPLDVWNALDFTVDAAEFATAAQGTAADEAKAAVEGVEYTPVCE
jgi:hypothetical protein